MHDSLRRQIRELKNRAIPQRKGVATFHNGVYHWNKKAFGSEKALMLATKEQFDILYILTWMQHCPIMTNKNVKIT